VLIGSVSGKKRRVAIVYRDKKKGQDQEGAEVFAWKGQRGKGKKRRGPGSVVQAGAGKGREVEKKGKVGSTGPRLPFPKEQERCWPRRREKQKSETPGKKRAQKEQKRESSVRHSQKRGMMISFTISRK